MTSPRTSAWEATMLWNQLPNEAKLAECKMDQNVIGSCQAMCVIPVLSLQCVLS